MKILVINSLLSAAYIVLSVIAIFLVDRVCRGAGVKLRPREDAAPIYVATSGGVSRVGPSAILGAGIVYAALMGGYLGWHVPELWMIDGRETWLDHTAQVIGCMCGIAVGAKVLDWIMTLGVFLAIVWVVVTLTVSGAAYVWESVSGPTIPGHSAYHDRRGFFERWREDRLADEARSAKEKKAVALKEFMSPFLGKWASRDQQGRLVGWLLIDKDGVEELDRKGNQKWGMVAEWEIAGNVLIANGPDQKKRTYVLRNNSQTLEEYQAVKGFFRTIDKIYIRVIDER